MSKSLVVVGWGLNHKNKSALLPFKSRMKIDGLPTRHTQLSPKGGIVTRVYANPFAPASEFWISHANYYSDGQEHWCDWTPTFRRHAKVVALVDSNSFQAVKTAVVREIATPTGDGKQ